MSQNAATVQTEKDVGDLIDATTEAMEVLRAALADLKRRVTEDDDTAAGGRHA